MDCILFYDRISMMETSDSRPPVARLGVPQLWKHKETQKEIPHQRVTYIRQWQVGHMCLGLMSLPMWALFVCSRCGNMSMPVRQEKSATLSLMRKELKHAAAHCLRVCVF